MESCEKESTRHFRRNSRNVLQDLLFKRGYAGDRDTTIPAQFGRDTKMIRSAAGLIRGKSKPLLFEGPDTVEVCKLQLLVARHNLLNKPTVHSNGTVADRSYLPSIARKPSNLTAMRGSLSQSCPYLHDKRRCSLSSSCSQKTGDRHNKLSNLKALIEAKKSNVTVTMTYLGQRPPASQDQLKVLQQINGGENICVFKGLVTPGEQFQFVSQRHRGYPFSATMYVNGMMAARISSCCEYRYAPGFQQGRKSCFKLVWLSGGLPCYRCTSVRNKYGSCQQLDNGTKENLILPLDQSPGKEPNESCPSTTLIIPGKLQKKKKLVRRTRKHSKEASGRSTDSEDPAPGVQGFSKPERHEGHSSQNKDKGKADEVNRGEKDRKRCRRSKKAGGNDDQTLDMRHRTHQKSPGDVRNPHGGPVSLQDEEALTQQKEEKDMDLKRNEESRDGGGTRDYYEECVEMSAALERGQNKHNCFKANILERCRLRKRLSSRPRVTDSDVELSEESDSIGPPVQQEVDKQHIDGEDADQALQTQLDAMMTVLNSSDEVDQLVLRKTDLTDDLLLNLVGALKSSPSEVTLLNLNLNIIGPYGAHILLDLLRAKPQVKGLHLFGNRLRDHGIQVLLNGIAELQEQTARAATIQQTITLQSEQQMNPALAYLHTMWGRGSLKMFTLSELDIGGNGLSSEGLKVLAAYVRHYSFLQFLGLAQTSSADLAAWKELFESLKGNNSLTQIILDESNLGDPGVRMLADMLKVNVSLRQVDLDRNDISDVGGNDIMGALLCRTQFPLKHLSLQDNPISAGLMRRIQEEVKNT